MRLTSESGRHVMARGGDKAGERAGSPSRMVPRTLLLHIFSDFPKIRARSSGDRRGPTTSGDR
jgi:hypothetical protein